MTTPAPRVGHRAVLAQRGERMDALPEMPEMTAKQRKRAAWAAWGLAVAVLVLTPLAALLPEGKLKTAAIIVLGVAGTVGTALTRGVRTQAATAAGAAACAIGLVIGAHAGCSPTVYQQGLQASHYLALARDAGATELLVRARAQHVACLGQHGAQTKAYESCARRVYQTVGGWLATGQALCRADDPLQRLLREMTAALPAAGSASTEDGP